MLSIPILCRRINDLILKRL